LGTQSGDKWKTFGGAHVPDIAAGRAAQAQRTGEGIGQVAEDPADTGGIEQVADMPTVFRTSSLI
jgi:hypothetical protein